MRLPRGVVVDLWPLYSSGEASPDTIALVDACLREDPELAEQLRRDVALPAAALPLPPDHEVRSLALTRRRLGGWPWLLFLALMFSAQAFGRIVADTAWQVSPRNFIVMASIAGMLWTAWLVSLWRMRARILIVPGRRR